MTKHPNRRLHADPLSPINAVAYAPSAAEVAQALRSGVRLNERLFDRFLPYDLRCVSEQHWTPLAAALRVAQWVRQARIKSVVDIGSGAGKFCVVAALASRCTFTGIEQRPRFVQEARALAELFGVADRVRFIQGSVSQCTMPVADAYYLYNPFGENLFCPEEHLDQLVELTPARYERDVAFMEQFFEDAPAGTYAIKYNGFGGQMPPCYRELRANLGLPNVLRMWQKDPGPAAA